MSSLHVSKNPAAILKCELWIEFCSHIIEYDSFVVMLYKQVKKLLVDLHNPT